MSEAVRDERLRSVVSPLGGGARLRQGVIGLALLATGCATAPQAEASYGWWGSNALEALVEAANTCGLQDVEMTLSNLHQEGEEDRHMVPSVFIPVQPSNPAFRCTMDWIRANPETGLRVPS